MNSINNCVILMGSIESVGCASRGEQNYSVSPVMPLYTLSLGKDGLLCKDCLTVGIREWKKSYAKEETIHAASHAPEWSDAALFGFCAPQITSDKEWWEYVEERIASVQNNAIGAMQFPNLEKGASNAAIKLDFNFINPRNVARYARDVNMFVIKAERVSTEVE